MQNELPGIAAELEKDRCKGLEVGEPNDTERITSQLLFGRQKLTLVHSLLKNK